jgi:hypothetical protein
LVYPYEDCDSTGMIFEIIFWDSLLGNQIFTYTVSPIAIPTGEFYAGFEMYYWQAELDPCADMPEGGWVSIQSIDSPNGCWFLWAGSEDGDLYCYQEGSATPDQYSDCAFEFNSICVENPPFAPTISGPNSGKPGQELTFVFNSLDPEGEDVRFHIDWGDGNEEWTDYVPSGTDKAVTHIWDVEDTYIITAFAQDYLFSGPSTTFTITIPRNKQEDCDCQTVVPDIKEIFKLLNYEIVNNRVYDNFGYCLILYIQTAISVYLAEIFHFISQEYPEDSIIYKIFNKNI